MLLVLTCVEYDGIEYNGYRFPPWAEAIGWLLVISSIILVPVWMLLQVVDTAGSWKVHLRKLLSKCTKETLMSLVTRLEVHFI